MCFVGRESKGLLIIAKDLCVFKCEGKVAQIISLFLTLLKVKRASLVQKSTDFLF